jgi:hypothetical protein
MRDLIPQKYRIIFFFILICLIGTAFLLIFLNQSNIRLPRNAEQKKSESFTFFSVGENTILTKSKLRELSKILGQHRLENLTPVYMDFVHRGWLASRFPDLKEAGYFFNKNRLINPISGRTLKLDYRYAHHYNVPFSDIRFVFCDYTKKPLFLNLRLSGDGKGIVNTLKESYGDPQMIEDQRLFQPSYFWEDSKALLVTAILANRYGKAETHIIIVYKENLASFMDSIMKEYPEPDVRTGF